ncbi:hypothetical protein [Micromonospora pattaloongensis]|uniref:hypothetical protein n=1 Tax=Micromonospora pattaloongensis TaxID=405436 RepID=UPI0011154312|nr:hypothetical protein [Micromonospora pattaloongensis]
MRRARAGRGGLALLLRDPAVTTPEIRWVAGRARERGETPLAEAALLMLMRRGAAGEQEERLVRRLGGLRPAPAGRLPAAPRGPASDGRELVIRRGPDAPAVRAGLAGEPARALDAWRPEWEKLPPSLADQLAVCALTRLGHEHRVTSVRAGDASAAPLAVAVAAALGAPATGADR